MRVLVACEYSGRVRDAAIVLGARCAMINPWNMHSSPISPLTVFSNVDSLNPAGERETFTTDTKSKTSGEGFDTTKGPTDTMVSICAMATVKAGGHTFTYLSPRHSLARSHSAALVSAISTEFQATTMPPILRGERPCKTNKTRERTGRGIPVLAESSQTSSGWKFVTAFRKARVRGRLRLNTGSAGQLSPGSSMGRLGGLI